jgi:hypothetical protein
MKSQDKNYIKFRQQMELKKIEKLKSSMHLIDVQNDVPINQHRFFVDDFEQGRKFNPCEQLNTHESLLNRKSNRLTCEQLKSLKMPDWVDDQFVKEISKTRAKKYKELVERVKRHESLNKLEQTYDLKPVSFKIIKIFNKKIVQIAVLNH